MNIFKKIGLLFQSNINKWFTKLVDVMHNDAELIHNATVIVSNINNFVQSSGADILTTIIPGNIDDTIKEIAREWLPKIIVKLHTAEDYSKLDADTILTNFIDGLKDIEADEKTFLLHNISAMLAKKMSGDKLNLGDIYGVIEGAYQALTKGQSLNTEVELPDFLENYIKSYPGEKEFSVTSDGQVFLKANAADAVAHQKTIDATKAVTVYTV